MVARRDKNGAKCTRLRTQPPLAVSQCLASAEINSASISPSTKSEEYIGKGGSSSILGPCPACPTRAQQSSLPSPLVEILLGRCILLRYPFQSSPRATQEPHPLRPVFGFMCRDEFTLASRLCLFLPWAEPKPPPLCRWSGSSLRSRLDIETACHCSLLASCLSPQLFCGRAAQRIRDPLSLHRDSG